MSRGGARPGSGRKPALFDEKRAISLKNQGFTYEQIANRFGVNRSAIRYFFRKQNEKTTYSEDQRTDEEST
jgi:orotate phosphoribosyltransferase-like protein